MATVSFLLRTTKKIAPLTVRLLFRHNKTDFVIASKTPILSTQDQWHIIKSAKKIKDAATLKEIKHIKSNYLACVTNIKFNSNCWTITINNKDKVYFVSKRLKKYLMRVSFFKRF